MLNLYYHGPPNPFIKIRVNRLDVPRKLKGGLTAISDLAEISKEIDVLKV